MLSYLKPRVKATDSTIMWLSLLATFQTCCEWTQSKLDEMYDRMRIWLGPGRSNYILLSNGDILPESMRRSVVWDDSALLFVADEKRIRPFISKEPIMKYQRLPWVSLTHTYGQTTMDLSDWVSELRTTTDIPLHQCVRLASLVSNVYLTESVGAALHVVTRSGDEFAFDYVGNVELVESEQ